MQLVVQKNRTGYWTAAAVETALIVTERLSLRSFQIVAACSRINMGAMKVGTNAIGNRNTSSVVGPVK